MRGARAVVGAVLLGSVLFLGGGTSAGASPPAGGSVKLFATPEDNSSLHTTVLFTGAIGDYGQALTINKNGTANANGNYVKVTLKHGTFEINSSALNAKANQTQPAVNNTTCSAALSVTGPVSLFNGTGLYAGISGTLNITETFAFITARIPSGTDKGKCNDSARPIAPYASITGSGKVKFG